MNVGHVETNGVLIAFTDGTRLFLGGSASAGCDGGQYYRCK
jgi:hypothetical protein